MIRFGLYTSLEPLRMIFRVPIPLRHAMFVTGIISFLSRPLNTCTAHDISTEGISFKLFLQYVFLPQPFCDLYRFASSLCRFLRTFPLCFAFSVLSLVDQTKASSLAFLLAFPFSFFAGPLPHLQTSLFSFAFRSSQLFLWQYRFFLRPFA